MKPVVCLFTLLCCTACSEGRTDHESGDSSILRKELRKMVAQDQAIQQAYFTTMADLPREERDRLRDSVFRYNGEVVKKIFQRHGFPDTSAVGSEGQHDFWLLVQHMDYDAGFQEEVLREMEKMVKRGTANAVDFAYLTDRVRLARGDKQWYGTQISHQQNLMAIPRPTADSLKMNKRRAAIGMETVEEYLNDYLKMHFELNRAAYTEKGLMEPHRYQVD